MADSIQEGDIISVHYTGRLDDGNQFDSTREREPFKFVVGAGQVVKGFDEVVVGRKTGDKVTITVPPEKAYGERLDEYVIELPKACMPHVMTISEGMQLKLPLQGGQVANATVLAVTDKVVRLDANHPMAGKTLVFDIEIIQTGLTAEQLFGENGDS